jgi:hypothetical protein
MAAEVAAAAVAAAASTTPTTTTATQEQEPPANTPPQSDQEVQGDNGKDESSEATALFVLQAMKSGTSKRSTDSLSEARSDDADIDSWTKPVEDNASEPGLSPAVAVETSVEYRKEAAIENHKTAIPPSSPSPLQGEDAGVQPIDDTLPVIIDETAPHL